MEDSDTTTTILGIVGALVAVVATAVGGLVYAVKKKGTNGSAEHNQPATTGKETKIFNREQIERQDGRLDAVQLSLSGLEATTARILGKLNRISEESHYNKGRLDRLYEMHDVRDDGQYIWYVKPSLEREIKANTQAAQRLAEEIRRIAEE